MDISGIIKRKRAKEELSGSEIDFFVRQFVKDEITEEEAGRFLLAVYENGLTEEETFALTLSMADSGKRLDLSDVGDCADKHSTGGISDTTTLIIVPVLASLGIKMAKMSGRSLGFTGGTADKMEVFKNLKTDLSDEQFKEQIRQIGAGIITQSEEIAVADKKIYRLRDKIGVVDSIPLIASSIMSKKIACGAKTLLLDVKFGSGAFMKNREDAEVLAELMVKIGRYSGINTAAIITDMNFPLSAYIGNNLEVMSSLRVLTGEKNMLSRISEQIVTQILLLSGKIKTERDGKKLFERQIKSHEALKKFRQIVSFQGGELSYFDNPGLLLPTIKQKEIFAREEGYLSGIDSEKLGEAVHLLAKGESDVEIKNQIGLILQVNLNSYVKKDTLLFKMFYNKGEKLSEAVSLIENSVTLSERVKKSESLIYKIIK